MLDSKPQTIQYAEFTRDMLVTMIEYFCFFADAEDVLTIEVNDLGIWVEEPTTKAKKFIGKARHSPKDLANMRHAKDFRRKN